METLHGRPGTDSGTRRLEVEVAAVGVDELRIPLHLIVAGGLVCLEEEIVRDVAVR